MRRLSGALVVTAAVSMLSGRATADSISFGDYFFPGDHLANGFASFTDGIVPFTVSGPGSGFVVEVEGGGFLGQFAHNTTVIVDNSAPGAVTIAFGSPIDSITNLAVQPIDFGPYTATLTAYDGATIVGSEFYTSFNAPGEEGSIPYFSLAAPGITSITLSSSNDGGGIAIGGGFGIPEAPAWAMMLSGFGLIGAAVRNRRLGRTASA